MATLQNAEDRGVSIRLVRAEDATALARLATQLGYPSTPEGVERRLASILPDPDHRVCVAESDGQVRAWLHAFVCRLVESDAHVEIGGLVVEEGLHRRGVGKLLMEHAEDWARQKGCGAIRLRSNVIRKGAHTFYEKLGYSHIKTQHAFCKTL